MKPSGIGSMMKSLLNDLTRRSGSRQGIVSTVLVNFSLWVSHPLRLKAIKTPHRFSTPGSFFLERSFPLSLSVSGSWSVIPLPWLTKWVWLRRRLVLIPPLFPVSVPKCSRPPFHLMFHKSSLGLCLSLFEALLKKIWRLLIYHTLEFNR